MQQYFQPSHDGLEYLRSKLSISEPKFLHRVIFLCLVLLASSCVSVEFDRMSGTAFPDEQFKNGENHSINSIFLDAGILVVVDEDDTNIPALNISDNECISDAELDSLEQGYRNSPLFPDDNTYYLWAVVVDHFGEVLGACSPNFVLGKMWSTHTRSALALFYPHSTIQNDDERYLRTTVHEIGHALNLHHEDGDGTTTIMNQSGDIGDDWVYGFSLDSQDHLQNHPSKCKYPGAVGGAPFTWVIDEHHAWHASASTAFNCN